MTRQFALHARREVFGILHDGCDPQSHSAHASDLLFPVLRDNSANDVEVAASVGIDVFT